MTDPASAVEGVKTAADAAGHVTSHAASGEPWALVVLVLLVLAGLAGLYIWRITALKLPASAATDQAACSPEQKSCPAIHTLTAEVRALIRQIEGERERLDQTVKRIHERIDSLYRHNSRTERMVSL